MVTLIFIPYSEIEGLSSIGRIRKLLNIAKEDKIVLLKGRLKKEEETELIKATMEEINKDFKGIELSVVYPSVDEDTPLFSRFKEKLINSVLGDRTGLKIIGPANVVKSIKNDPKKIELLTKEVKKKRKNNKKKRK